MEDNVIGLLLCDLVLRASLSGVPTIRGLCSVKCKRWPTVPVLTEDNILQWLHIHAFSVSKNALKEAPATLEDAGLIEVKRRGGGRGGGQEWAIVKTRTGRWNPRPRSTLLRRSQVNP